MIKCSAPSSHSHSSALVLFQKSASPVSLGNPSLWQHAGISPCRHGRALTAPSFCDTSHGTVPGLSERWWELACVKTPLGRFSTEYLFLQSFTLLALELSVCVSRLQFYPKCVAKSMYLPLSAEICNLEWDVFDKTYFPWSHSAKHHELLLSKLNPTLGFFFSQMLRKFTCTYATNTMNFSLHSSGINTVIIFLTLWCE